MTLPALPTILYVGNDASLEYLLGRYAQRSGCRIESTPANLLETDVGALRPLSVWFSSLQVLETARAVRSAAASLDIPLVVCLSVADDARALELGADYVFLHPITYDCFISTLRGAYRSTKTV